jgi:hypothetical protein
MNGRKAWHEREDGNHMKLRLEQRCGDVHMIHVTTTAAQVGSLLSMMVCLMADHHDENRPEAERSLVQNVSGRDAQRDEETLGRMD